MTGKFERMMRCCWALLMGCLTVVSTGALASPGPNSIAGSVPIERPKDRAYPGEITLIVDASDVDRRIVSVHETVSGITGETTLLYPQWLPGAHAPEGTIDRLAGLKVSAQGAPIAWTRDPVEVNAFRIHAPSGVKSLDIDFQYLSPVSAKVGALEYSRDLLYLEWNSLVLYPAGYFARQIPVRVDVTLPPDWKFATALEALSSNGARTAFKPVDLERFIDSPLFAGRYAARVDLDPGSAVPVHLNVFADRPEQLAATPAELAAYRALVQQAYKLFGSHHYSHYDFLFSLSDQVAETGLEHHQSSENGSDPQTFLEWDKTAFDRDLLGHEFTHSWNGKFRRPADLWTPNYNVPMQNSLLWVYEGQTEYWGQVLTARSGLWTKQQALDELAETAAFYEHQAGRQWRSVQDTTTDEIINPRRPMSWRSWQRYEDYYQEGKLIWLDADTLIREQTGGTRSLDDFARAFFGVDDGSFSVVTYTFDDVVKALKAVTPYDWAGFLRSRVDQVDKPVPLDGVTRGGYRLIYSDTQSELSKARDAELKRVSLSYSIGIEIDDQDGSVLSVVWDSPAFRAKLTKDSQILAVNGSAYNGDSLKADIQAAKAGKSPIELILKTGDRFRVVSLDYHDGLRYPHLERNPAVPARLDDILDARK